MDTVMKHQCSPDRKALSTISSNTSNIPVSPTANLKLLTKVASELVSPLLNTKPSKKNANRESDLKTRKEKSLGILCDKFLAMFPLILPPGCQVLEISLDRVAQQLGIVKRRIYDIINILESLQMASKIAKNRYHWHGCQNLKTTLSQLKTMALEFGIDQKLKEIQAQQIHGSKLVSGPTCCCSKDCNSNVDPGDPNILNTGDGEFSQRHGNGFLSDERTLGVMCLKFIMLFLASPQSRSRINLDLATRMLVSEAAEGDSERQLWGMKVECHKTVVEKSCETGSKNCRCTLRLKTKVRRLYDIANVLTSLGLIAKVESPPSSMRKPVFTYTGPAVGLTSVPDIQHTSIKKFFVSVPFEDDVGVENKTKNGSLKRKDPTSKSGPPHKISRKLSDNNLDKTFGRRSAGAQNLSARHASFDSSIQPEPSHSRYRCSLDDILNVAGQELEKIRTSEELEAAQRLSGARKKLSFLRCHSDSCIQPAVSPQHKTADLKEQNLEDGLCAKNIVASQKESNSSPKKRVCITLTDSKNKRFTITRKLVEVPSHALPVKLKERPVKLQSITPMQVQTLGALFGVTQQIQPLGMQTFSDRLSVMNADVENNNKPAASTLVNTVDRSNNSPSVPSCIAPGELYRAVKVGNVIRLVPFTTTSFGTKGTDCKK